ANGFQKGRRGSCPGGGIECAGDGTSAAERPLIPGIVFWTLPLFKRDALPLAQFVETYVRTRRLMDEVLLAVCRCDEPEALAGQRFDRPVHRRHVVSVRIEPAKARLYSRQP